MKLPRRPVARVLALTTTAMVVVGAGAVADTSSVPVTLRVVNGSRSLLVTGSDGSLPVGSPQLSFGTNRVTSPFGVVVTDLAYERTGYSVTATLSDLYRLETSGAVDCASEVPAGAFSVGFDPLPAVTDVEAVVEPFLTFTDSDVNEDLTLLGLDLSLLGVTSTLTTTVSNVAGFAQELDASSLTLMAVTDGGGGAFADQAEHPRCPGSGATTPTPVGLQTGATNTPDLTGLTTTLYGTVNTDTAQAITAAETIAAGLLPIGADQEGGTLWEATRNSLVTLLADYPLINLTTSQLKSLTDSVVADLLAGTSDLVLDLVGQSGAYPNLPVMNLDTAQLGDATTGLYHGVMTVTLVDDTP